MKVAVTRTINCAHQLDGTVLHGHTYRITATLRGIAEGGKVVDFGVLRGVLDRICDDLDHRCLDPILPVPTAENLAEMIRLRLANGVWAIRNVRVRVEVGDDGWVETE